MCLPEVSAAAWRLAVLSSELADAELAVRSTGAPSQHPDCVLSACLLQTLALHGCFFFCHKPAPSPIARSATLQEFAGELLALAGPLDPSAIAFDPASAFSSAAPSPGAAAAVASGSGSSGGGTQTPAPTQGGRSGRPGRRSQGSPGGRGGGGSGSGSTWAAALAQLADYLVDESVEVIRTAQYTLRLLLSTPEGQEALQQLDPALRPYLEAFRHGPGEPGTHKVAAGAAAQAAQAGAAEAGLAGGRRLQLDSRQLWRCDGRPYDDWVCQLACAMLRKVRAAQQAGAAGMCDFDVWGCFAFKQCPLPVAPVGHLPTLHARLQPHTTLPSPPQASGATLASCQRMAACKPAFAELLLPHAFADLAVQPDSGSLALQLGSLISQQLLPRLHRHPKAARLILSCLNHLRSLYLDAKVAGSSGGSSGSKGKKSKADSDAAAINAEIELWRKVRWAELGVAVQREGRNACLHASCFAGDQPATYAPRCFGSLHTVYAPFTVNFMALSNLI